MERMVSGDFPHATPEAGAKATEQVFSEIRTKFDAAGLDLDYLISKLKDELEANITRCFNSQGTVLYSTPLVDWKTRQTARQDAHKLRGDYPAERVDVTAHGTDVQALITAIERADAITARITGATSDD